MNRDQIKLGNNRSNYFRDSLIGIMASLALLSTNANASITPLDLGDFFTSDPEVSVVSPNQAIMTDSMIVNTVSLTLDPSLGDPNIIIPAVQRELTFDYEFTLGMGNIDEFSAYLFNADVGPFSVLDSVTLFSSGMGSVTFDLSDYLDLTLGLQFELFDPGIELGAMVTISNLALIDPQLIPEPTTTILLLIGLIPLFVCRKPI
jgi:hypothetical protein